MIIRKLDEARETERLVHSDGWDSTRLLLAGDNMGFSFHITRIHENAELNLHYKHHFESVYCISGSGSIEDCVTGEVHEIRPGTMYALNLNDKHVLRATEEMVMACTFNPPVTGSEVHREDGSYAPAEDAA
ncbi:ectoine synthase [Mariluticola halotolerans]|uniref:ectoine synthase n=1 Tax=Mariluticola halotolerans TaxID=2909283 RepID=UPI0026E466C3|nr:ectoine synthase [Mariluticola halotolerans]UJQ93081.1 ectoine synthase [Mariluticola halotolerans]